MKVLFCTNVFQKVSNGPAKFAHLLLSEAENCGFEFHVLTEDIYAEVPAVHKLKLNIPKKLELLSQFIRMWKYHKAAITIRNQYQFDVLVYNNAFVGLMSSMLFKPTVGMINDDNNAVKSFRSIWLKHFVFHRLESLACDRMKRIIVNSCYLENILSGQYRKEKNKFSVLYKGIENALVEMNRQAIIKQKEQGSILFVKTDFKTGGLSILVQAIKLMDISLKLYIVGPNKTFHEILSGELKGTKIDFKIYDYLPQTEVYGLMKSCEIFCVPSYFEAFGVANLEALAFGCKIVSTNAGGIPEALKGNRLAWLVDPGNPFQLKEALTDAFAATIEDNLVAIDKHLNNFKSSLVATRFKSILEECL
jgi:glycosyltransferase involved in cell wall biosynthesis